MQARNRRIPLAAAAVAIAIAAAAVVWPTQEKGTLAVVPTGQYVNGAPVYRLPTVTVATTRSAELAKIAREEAMASAAAPHDGR